jgi:hypothetical protein
MIDGVNSFSVKAKSLLVVSVLIGLFSQQVTGANYWYRQDSEGDCSWDGKVWYWSKGSTSYLTDKTYDQFGADYLGVNTATEECPLRVTNGIPAVAQTLVIGDAAGDEYSPVLKVESGGSVTVKDLHIGKKVNGFNMLEDQKFVLAQAIETIKNKHIDVVMVDPPRKGCSQVFLDQLLTLSPKKVVYLSPKYSDIPFLAALSSSSLFIPS